MFSIHNFRVSRAIKLARKLRIRSKNQTPSMRQSMRSVRPMLSARDHIAVQLAS